MSTPPVSLKPAGQPQPGWASHRARAHAARCRSLPRPTDGDVQAMVASFLERGGQITLVQSGALSAGPTPILPRPTARR